jgi:hypothetical protein
MLTMIEVLITWNDEEGKCFALCCVMSCFAGPLALTSLAHCFSFFVVILFLFLSDHFLIEMDWVGGQLCGNTTAMCLG